MTPRNIEARFRHHGAEDINTKLDHVTGWVPTENVEALLEEVDDATAQYETRDGRETFVTTL